MNVFYQHYWLSNWLSGKIEFYLKNQVRDKSTQNINLTISESRNKNSIPQTCSKNHCFNDCFINQNYSYTSRASSLVTSIHLLFLVHTEAGQLLVLGGSQGVQLHLLHSLTLQLSCNITGMCSHKNMLPILHIYHLHKLCEPQNKSLTI